MTHISKFPIFLGVSVLLLSGCGFQPVYGTHRAAPSVAGAIPSQIPSQTTARALSQIDIAIIPDRAGQMLRNDLIDRLYRGGYPANPVATLHIRKLEERKTELDLTKSSEATRAQLRISTKMKLIDSAGQILLDRDLSTITSYNVLGSEFATRVSEEDARQNAIHDLARQVELNLSLYYNASHTSPK